VHYISVEHATTDNGTHSSPIFLWQDNLNGPFVRYNGRFLL
jgi:hypothetical protein